MVYVASDGSIHESQPWGVKKIVDTLWGFLDSVGLFVQTLLPFHFEMPRLANRAVRSSSNSNAPRNNFQSGRRPGGPANRPGGGGFRTMSDILPPPPTSACGGGGCGGGSCGR